MTVIMIGLGEDVDGNYDGIIKLLSILLSSIASPKEKKKILEEDFEIKMTKKMESEVNEMCNLSDGIEERGNLKTLKNLMKSTGWDMQKTMEMMGMDEKEQEKYKKLLSESKGYIE